MSVHILQFDLTLPYSILFNPPAFLLYPCHTFVATRCSSLTYHIWCKLWCCKKAKFAHVYFEYIILGLFFLLSEHIILFEFLSQLYIDMARKSQGKQAVAATAAAHARLTPVDQAGPSDPATTLVNDEDTNMEDQGRHEPNSRSLCSDSHSVHS